jgi:hypothetical protein
MSKPSEEKPEQGQSANPAEPRGAKAMLGFAKRFRPTRSTQEWMDELREGER